MAPISPEASAPIFPFEMSINSIFEASMHCLRERSLGFSTKNRLTLGCARKAPTLFRIGTVSFLVYLGNSSRQKRTISPLSDTCRRQDSLKFSSWSILGISPRSDRGNDTKVSRTYLSTCSSFAPQAPLQSFLKASSRPPTTSSLFSLLTLRRGLYRYPISGSEMSRWTTSPALCGGICSRRLCRRSPCTSKTAQPRPCRISCRARVVRRLVFPVPVFPRMYMCIKRSLWKMPKGFPSPRKLVLAK